MTTEMKLGTIALIGAIGVGVYFLTQREPSPERPKYQIGDYVTIGGGEWFTIYNIEWRGTTTFGGMTYDPQWWYFTNQVELPWVPEQIIL